MHSRLIACAMAALLATTMATPALAQFQDAITPPTPAPAETIYINGRIATPDGWQTAVAIGKGTILAIGNEAQMNAHRTGATRMVDLGGKTVLPGLIDMHVHAVDAGLHARECGFAQGSAATTVVAAVKTCVAQAKPGAWVVGGQWDASSLGKVAPHRRILDAVAPHVPVVLHDISLHSVWVNSAALAAAGIDRNTQNPAGGVIERDSKGEPTGVLRENAAIMLLNKVPPPGDGDRVEALRLATQAMLAQGITAYEEALMATANARAYAALSDAGGLAQHVRTCMWDSDQGLIAQRHLYARPGLDVSCVKMILDGVPTDSHTAAMHDPYADAAAFGDASRARGSLIIAPEAIAQHLARYDAAGLTVKLHAAGDASVHAALDAIAAARKANGTYGPHHEIAHGNFVLPEDIGRARDLGATFEFSPYIWFPSPPVQDLYRTVGPQRMARFTPVREALDAGARVVIGSDWPVVPSMSPWVAIETLVTRETPGGGATALAPSQKVSVADALRMMTVSAAMQLGIGDRVGTLEPGRQADLIVIDRDIFAIPPREIHATRVLRTVIAGKEVYQAKP
ncbi:amidohydrolase [Novosphingobium sp. KACC 22771]|uniref:amidohydrolase n=1 Tax=Novosphingobium sp. KACC 22771 TaxID=3025670 RepID=UPI0023655B9B|nr:amidohydrolase [Novosphingobium sp. KACC 22771]WDF75014.1 amidohydrolase [Novosphingobium sp. KACC 22771]